MAQVASSLDLRLCNSHSGAVFISSRQSDDGQNQVRKMLKNVFRHHLLPLLYANDAHADSLEPHVVSKPYTLYIHN